MEPFGTSGDVICPIPELQWLVSNARRSIPGQSKQSFGSPSRKGTRRAFTLSQAIIWSHARAAAFAILGAITFCHLLNDVMQALLPAIYPMLKSGFDLSFGQIGLLTLIFQVTASLLQPMVGLYGPQAAAILAAAGHGLFAAGSGMLTVFLPSLEDIARRYHEVADA